MALTISLPSDAETTLRARAQAAGKDVNEYAQQLLANELSAPLLLTDAAEPFARAVDTASVSDEQLISIVNDARAASRADRRRRST